MWLTPGRAGGTPEWVISEDADLNRNGMIFWSNRRAVVLAARPAYFDTKKLDPRFPLTRREQLADFIADDPQFARAYVNRIWAQLFGRGLTQLPAVDDIGAHNDPVHPELLDTLANEFVTAGYDPRVLIGWLCNTQAYQRECAANPTNADPELEVYFSRMPLKPMSPEQLFTSSLGAARGQTSSAEHARLWKRWATTFAQDAAEVGSPAGCLDRQAGLEPLQTTLMALVNEKEFDDAETLGRIGRLADVDCIVGEIYLAVLNRHPRVEERQNLAKEIAVYRKEVGTDLTPFWQDLFWAVQQQRVFLQSLSEFPVPACGFALATSKGNLPLQTAPPAIACGFARLLGRREREAASGSGARVSW